METITIYDLGEHANPTVTARQQAQVKLSQAEKAMTQSEDQRATVQFKDTDGHGIGGWT